MGEDTKGMSQAREAWSQFGDEFADIARRFKENYDAVAGKVTAGNDKSQKSIERAVKAIRKAMDETAKSITTALRDEQVLTETEEAGSALLKAVGTTFEELGEALKREAQNEKDAVSSS